MDQNFPPVDPEKAKLLTANWRDYYTAIYNNPKPPVIPPISPDGESVFRGFRVPLDDLTQILEVIQKYNGSSEHEDKINSIRVYLAKDSADEKIMDDIHILLVPVVGGQPIPGPGLTKYGKDMLETDAGSKGSVSTIYNFSTPCPRQCDISSPLYKREKPE